MLIHNARVILEDGVIDGGVLIQNRRIKHVFRHDGAPAVLSGEDIDAKGDYLAPGLIDIHIHGSAGVDLQNTDSAGIARVAAYLAQNGIAGFFPTLVPDSMEAYKTSIQTIASYADSCAVSYGSHRPDGRSEYVREPAAKVLGIHFEGPFVSPALPGALRPEYFRVYDGDPKSAEFFCDPAPGHIDSVLMTVAPELPRGIELIDLLGRRGVRSFIGHTAAAPEALDLALRSDARHCTHVPNAMQPLHHRRPGAAGWSLAEPAVSIDCIADLKHVHPLMLRLMYLAKGPANMALISDAVAPAGLGDGIYRVWGKKIQVSDGTAVLSAESSGPGCDPALPGTRAAPKTKGPGPTLTGPEASSRSQVSEGTLAGSVTTLAQCVRNVIGLGVPIHEAVHMASLVPARAAGIDKEWGSIHAGKRASLFLFKDTLADIRWIGAAR